MFRLYAYCGFNRWQNILHAWRLVSRNDKNLTGQQHSKTSRSARPRNAMWFAMVRSIHLKARLERQRKRNKLCFWEKHFGKIPKRKRFGSHLQSPLSSRQWIWVFRWQTTSYGFFSSKLLWRVWQRWCVNECRWKFDVFFLNIETRR